jgi:hypothetical protein
MTTFTLTGPTSTTLLSPAVYKITPSDSSYTGTLTPSDGGAGGLFYPATIPIAASPTAITLVYIPGVGQAGSSASISLSGNPAITAPTPIVLAISGSVALADTFNRANTALGAAGTANVGNGWTDIFGNVWNIASDVLNGVANNTTSNTNFTDDLINSGYISSDQHVKLSGAYPFGTATAGRITPTIVLRYQAGATGAQAQKYLLMMPSNVRLMMYSVAASGAMLSTIATGVIAYTFTTGNNIDVHAMAIGVSPTTLTLVVVDTTAHALVGVVTGTDSTAFLQAAGGIGIEPDTASGTGAGAVQYTGLSIFGSQVANTYTVSGPAQTLNNASASYVVTPNAPFNGTITLASSIAGTFSPAVLTFTSSSQSAQACLFTPTAIGSGTVTATNNAGLTNPSAQNLTVVASQAIAYNNSNIYYTGANWSFLGGVAQSNWQGAYAKIGFSGSNFAVNFNQLLAGEKVFWTVDGGGIQRATLPSGTSSLLLAGGLTAGQHQIFLGIDGLGITDLWMTPQDAINITGYLTDAAGSLIAPTLFTKSMLLYCDSIGIGWLQLIGTPPASMQFSTTYMYLLTQALGIEISVIGAAGTSYEVTGNGGMPTFNTYWNTQKSGVARIFPANFDYIWDEHGQNGVNSASDVTNMIANLRALYPNAIYFKQIPLSQAAADLILQGVYAANDPKVSVLNLLAAGQSLVSANSLDGEHPDAAAGPSIKLAMLNAFVQSAPLIQASIKKYPASYS